MSSPAVTTGVNANLDHNSTVVVTVVSLIFCGVIFAVCKPLASYFEAKYVFLSKNPYFYYLTQRKTRFDY